MQERHLHLCTDWRRTEPSGVVLACVKHVVDTNGQWAHRERERERDTSLRTVSDYYTELDRVLLYNIHIPSLAKIDQNKRERRRKLHRPKVEITRPRAQWILFHYKVHLVISEVCRSNLMQIKKSSQVLVLDQKLHGTTFGNLYSWTCVISEIYRLWVMTEHLSLLGQEM